MTTFTSTRKGNIITFYRDAGVCYGGIRKTYIDCDGIPESEIYDYVKDYLGKAYADAI